MKPTIHLALTHDWEIRGDGSGDIEEIQFAPMRRLLKIYARYGAHATFMPDAMQQIAFRNFEGDHPHLREMADSWEEHAREAFRQGHDLQLHLHAQWSEATYQDRQWDLRSEWSLLKYSRDQVKSMLASSKTYLESVLRPLDPAYHCVAFRGSALAVAPSPHLLLALADQGIEIDVSVAAGIYLNNQTLQLDYRNCDETFLPYYPQLDDARKVSSRRERIVCVPLNHFYGSRAEVTKHNLSMVGNHLRTENVVAVGSPMARLDSQQRGFARVYEKLIEPALKRKYFVSDTSRLNYPLMREMLASIRQRARETGLSEIPIVITNHPKHMRDWDALEKFIGDLADADDIRFVTLREIAEKIRNGEFSVRSNGVAS